MAYNYDLEALKDTMKIKDHNYTFSDNEFKEMWQLLIDSYSVASKLHSWPFAELENWPGC